MPNYTPFKCYNNRVVTFPENGIPPIYLLSVIWKQTHFLYMLTLFLQVWQEFKKHCHLQTCWSVSFQTRQTVPEVVFCQVSSSHCMLYTDAAEFNSFKCTSNELMNVTDRRQPYHHKYIIYQYNVMISLLQFCFKVPTSHAPTSSPESSRRSKWRREEDPGEQQVTCLQKYWRFWLFQNSGGLVIG